MDLSRDSKKELNSEYANWIRVYNPLASQPKNLKATIVIDLDHFREEFEKIKEYAFEANWTDKNGNKINHKKVKVDLWLSNKDNLFFTYNDHEKKKQINSKDFNPDRDS
tara:strand:- start:2685 stop:3011 length:327 start_codon:yes stop_codon:yes gene_type:complete